MTPTLRILLPLLALLVAAPARADDAADGRRLYQRLCASCHGTGGRGDGPVAPALGEPPPDLTVLARENDGAFPAIRVVAAIDGTTMARAHGVSDMPVWGEVLAPTGGAEEETDARDTILLITEYLRTIQRR
jgi:mono/diheme cytochrome c family protein